VSEQPPAKPPIIITWAFRLVTRPASQTAAAPFAVSKTQRENPASGRRPTRATLVAPMLPLPLCARPHRQAILRGASPKGIEPRSTRRKDRKKSGRNPHREHAPSGLQPPRMEKLSTVVYSAPEGFSLLRSVEIGWCAGTKTRAPRFSWIAARSFSGRRAARSVRRQVRQKGPLFTRDASCSVAPSTSVARVFSW